MVEECWQKWETKCNYSLTSTKLSFFGTNLSTCCWHSLYDLKIGLIILLKNQCINIISRIMLWCQKVHLYHLCDVLRYHSNIRYHEIATKSIVKHEKLILRLTNDVIFPINKFFTNLFPLKFLEQISWEHKTWHCVLESTTWDPFGMYLHGCVERFRLYWI